MCRDCDAKFDHMTAHFDESLAVYRQDCEQGNIRDTPAKRVADIAAGFLEMPDHEACRVFASWYVAVAMERLMALELSGIPT